MEESRSFFQSRYKKGALIGLLLICIVTVLLIWLGLRKRVWTNDAYIDGFYVSVSPDVEARITKLYVDEGDCVQAGQLLCEMDDTILQAQRIESETNITLLKESIILTQIKMEKLRDDYIVAKKEFESDIISPLDFDHKQKDFKIAQSQHQIAMKELENGIAKLGVIMEKLQHTKVYAPRNGAIAKRWVLPGDVSQFGQTLFTLNDLCNIWVTANLEETKLKRVKVGSPVKIHIDSYPGKTFTGKVWVVRAAAASQFSLIPPDNATGNYTKVVQRIPIKIQLDVPDDQKYYLFPGMSCEVRIKIR